MIGSEWKLSFIENKSRIVICHIEGSKNKESDSDSNLEVDAVKGPININEVVHVFLN